MKVDDLVNEISTTTKYDEMPILINENDIVIDEEKANKFSLRNYGNFKCFLFYKKDPIIVIGPEFAYFLTISIILFIPFYLIYFLYRDSLDYTVRLIGTIIYSLQFLTFTIIALKNPGIPSNNYYEEYFKDPSKGRLKYEKCSRCGSLMNMDGSFITFHCATCDCCIENFDHHCPFMSKCIGRGNIVLFYLFLVLTPLYIITLIISIALIN